MSPIDQQAYYESAFDRLKVDRYAARVSRETRRPILQPDGAGQFVGLPEHWVVFGHEYHQRQNFRSRDRRGDETDEFTHIYTRIALTRDGRLLCAVRNETQVEVTSGRGFSVTSNPHEFDVNLATDQDLLSLDHGTREFRFESGKNIKWGNRPGGPAVRHAKGVGINLALKALLT